VKTAKFTTSLTVMLVFSGLNVAMCQWTTSGNNIYNTNSGHVGIGNSTPITLLHVGKNMTEPAITVQNFGGSGGATFRMTDNVSGADWKFKATNTGGFKIRDNANALDVFTIESNSAANALYINSAGNVGIGTNAPAASFHVAESSPGFTAVFGTPISTWNASTNVSIGDDNGLSALYLGQSEAYKGYVYWNYWDPPQLAFLGIGCSDPINPVILQPFGGKVGINGYPSATLDLRVNGYDAYSGLMITNTNTGGKSISINQGTVGKLNFTEPGVIDLVTMDFNTQNVGIGITTPNNSAILELSSTSKGFLPPRMTQSQISSISNPANGLMVFCTTTSKLYAYIESENVWKEILLGP
jgi:hypothetical protein